MPEDNTNILCLYHAIDFTYNFKRLVVGDSQSATEYRIKMDRPSYLSCESASEFVNLEQKGWAQDLLDGEKSPKWE